MKRPSNAVLFTMSCLLAAPLMAQTQIGAGTCSSATLSPTSTYAFSLTGRQVTASGNFTNVFQANGAATFDGLSKVTMTMTTGTLAAIPAQLTWSGTYSVQANCVGVVNITSGGSVTLNLVLYAQGANFLMTGNDATYSYSGSGNNQPTSCSAATFSGVYTFSGTGFGISGGSVNGVSNATGLLQFDGQSHLTANLTLAQSGKALAVTTLAGSYSISANCLGSATLTDSNSNSYVMSFSAYTATNLYTSQFYAMLGQNGKLLLSGSANAIYGQPTATPSDRGSVSGGGL